MTLGLISDIHGNYEALKCVMKRLDEMGVTEVYCLGDVVGYYSQVNECCDLLRERNIPTLMGNHDWYMAGGGFCPRSQSVNDCLEYQRTIISDENLAWLKTLKLQAEAHGVRMVHGGWTNPVDEYIVKPTAEYFAQVEGNLFASGHTHVQRVVDFGDKIYCNPGSVGQPRDSDPRAAFATFDGSFSLHRVDYDRERVFKLMDTAGFNDYYYGCLQTGAKNLCRLPEEAR